MDEEENQPKRNFYRFLSSSLPKVIFVLVIFAFGIWVGQNVALPFGSSEAPVIRILNKNTPKSVQADFAPFWDVWDRVTADYLERSKLDPQKLIYGAISGLVKSVGDPYTVFLDPDENKDFELSLSGIYEGVGIELDVRDNNLIVVAPLEGSPAAKAGVVAGDIISEIDGLDASTLSIQDAVQKIRGKAGTSVKLTLQRNGKKFDVELARAKIVIKSVEFKDLGANTAQIKIIRFGDNTLSEWDSAVNKFISGGYKKLILDVRNDPGGRLDYSISVVGDFVNKNTTVVMEEDSSGKRELLRSKNDPRLLNVPVIVLINKGSASASEIVAGALRDLLGAKLVGEASFGKGTIQRVDNLPHGAGLHITFAKWLTPKGTWVNKKGLAPDFVVKMTEKDTAAGRDPQLSKALELLKK